MIVNKKTLQQEFSELSAALRGFFDPIISPLERLSAWLNRRMENSKSFKVSTYALGFAFVTLICYPMLSAQNAHKARVIDPDTLDVGLDQNLRIVDMDGPEKGWRAKCDAERELESLGTAFAQELLDNAKRGRPILSNPPRRDSYGRYLGDYEIDGRLYSDIMESAGYLICLLYTSPSPRDRTRSRMPSSA